MGKELVVLLGTTLLLSSCGGYFDRHPANVRPESEAVATVLAHQRPVVSALSGPVTAAPAAPAQVTEAELPAPAPLPPKHVVTPSGGTPPELPSPTRESMQPAKSVTAVAGSPGAPAATGRAPSVNGLPAPAPLAPKRVVARSSGTPPELASTARESTGSTNSVAAAAVSPGAPASTGRVSSAPVATPVVRAAPVTQVKPPPISAPQHETGPITATQPSPTVAAIQSRPVTQIEPPHVSAPQYKTGPITVPQS